MKKIKDKYLIILFLIIIIGLAIRIIYSVSTIVYTYQYDIGINSYDVENIADKILAEDEEVVIKNGQLDYIINLFKNNALPTGSNYQAFHPPLNYMIFALFLKVFNLFKISSDLKLALLKIVPLIYTVIFWIILYKLLDELGYSKKRMIIPFTILIFLPNFVFMSRLINNDFLLLIFTMLVLLYLIKWDKDESYKNAILMALFLGLGGMTKTSIICMALPIGVILFIHFFRKIDASNWKDLKKIIFQIVIIGIISLPLILWYQIRGSILFGTPIFSIQRAHETLNVGSNKFIDRWLINSELFDTVLEANASNVFSYVINSILLVDFVNNFNNLLIISKFLMCFSILGIIIGIVKNRLKDLILIITYLTWICSFVTFNMEFPASCTMNVRYILITLVIASIYFEIFVNKIKNPIIKKIIITLFIIFVLLCSMFDVYLILFNY